MTLKSFLKVSLYLLLLGFACLNGNELLAQTSDQIKSTVPKPVPVIELKGNGYERGLQHGRKLKVEIAQVYSKWKDNIRNVVNGNPDSVITAFLSGSNFEANSLKYTPWLLKELLGIADGIAGFN